MRVAFRQSSGSEIGNAAAGDSRFLLAFLGCERRVTGLDALRCGTRTGKAELRGCYKSSITGLIADWKDPEILDH